jgi:hypothetical protein
MKNKVWKCPVCKVGVVSITPAFNRHRYGCNNCLSVFFADGKQDTRFKPMNKSGWLRGADLPTIEEVKKLVKERS